MIAAIDCGTNTIKLYLGDPVAYPGEPVLRTARMVRLGQGVDRTGRLDDAALARAFAAIEEYAALIAQHPVRAVRFCATSATRDAANAAEFAAGVRERLGVEPEVLSGAEEAALSYAGAVRNLRRPPAEPTLVVDIGGGSTELVLGDAEGARDAVSMDVGSVRLHERHLHDDPPSAAQVAALEADVDAALARCGVPVADAAQVVFVAGTALTVGAGALGHGTFDAARLDQAVLTRAQVDDEVARLVAMTAAERASLGHMHPGRADVIGAGALIMRRVLDHVGAERLTLSVADILDGIALSLAQA